MVRSWGILIPINMVDGFDSVLTSLENTVWAPGQVQWRPTSAEAGSSRGQFIMDDGG
jgi:hypothetical protein